MTPMKLPKPNRLLAGHWLSGGIAAGLAAVLGLILFLFSIGGGITRLSYDFPFALRGDIHADEAAIVYLDEISHKELNQSMTAPWDRSLHARLIDTLMAQGAKAIVFDILFTGPSDNPAADQQLAEAIKRSGRVVMGANFGQSETTPGVVGKWEELPYGPFADGAAAWGNVNLLLDPDYGIRRNFPNLENISGQSEIFWMPWAAAQLAGAPVTKLNPQPTTLRWLNYYAPPGGLPAVSFFAALKPDSVPPGFFKDKVVFVGAKLSADFSGKGKDEFATPYTRWGKGFAPGVEIHATAFLNFLRGDWLTRLPFAIEFLLVLLGAVLGGFGLACLRPLPATLVAMAAVVSIFLLAFLMFSFGHLWFDWIILPIQFGVCLLCSIIHNSLKIYVEKKLIEQSLAAHLSPALVKQLVHNPSLRRPGGTKQEVSILFTDIANFSRVSESMHPDDLVNLLNHYFEAALKCIHETDGTVIDLIGDAILAIWNAPVEQPDHCERACRAAMKLHEQLVDFGATRRSLPLKTRVGLHTGTVCVGNIGSQIRFNYTAIGENVNLASRLEGLNKHLGTDVLTTREIQRAVEDKMTSRPIGHFKFKGFGRAVEIHELLGSPDVADNSREWREKFADALQNFRQRKFDAAEKEFRETIELRKAAERSVTHTDDAPTDDGPSKFYLDQIADLRLHPPAYEWIGEVSLREK
jgi:adenylate cyclase